MQHLLSRRSDLVEGAFLAQQGADGAGLGHPPALLKHHTLAGVELQKRDRRCGAANADTHQVIEARRLETRQLAHEEKVRRHAKDMRDAAVGS